ncbi:MAG: carboxymuconolactone decarboxylase family protein [Desulfovibrio sp.]
MRQTEIKQNIGENMIRFKSMMPEFTEGYSALNAEAYADGDIPSKHKRLMALCTALTHGCKGCILYQLSYALDGGATVDEVLETVAVSIAIGGTMAAAESTRVMAYLKEIDLIE